MEHENKRLERRHVQEHLDAGGDALLQEFAGQRPAEGERMARVETAVAGLREELGEQDDRRNDVADKRPVGSPRHTHRGDRTEAENQHEVAGDIDNHADERGVHHDFRFADTAEEARRHVAHERYDATEHQDVEVSLLVFQLVGGQVLDTEKPMAHGNRQVQERHTNQRDIERLHKDARAFPVAFCPEPLRHHGRRVADGPRKEHRKRELHRARPEGSIHLGGPEL